MQCNLESLKSFCSAEPVGSGERHGVRGHGTYGMAVVCDTSPRIRLGLHIAYILVARLCRCHSAWLGRLSLASRPTGQRRGLTVADGGEVSERVRATAARRKGAEWGSE